MYEEFFGLNSSPFQLSPDPLFLYSSEQNKIALATISDAVRQRKGFVVLTGEVGTGKTLVLRCLLESWEREEPFAYSSAGDYPPPTSCPASLSNWGLRSRSQPKAISCALCMDSFWPNSKRVLQPY